MTNLQCTTTTIERVFPPDHTSPTTITKQLSLVDASVANFSECSAIWFFDAKPGGVASLNANRIREAFRNALEQCPHFCGFLHLLPYDPEKPGNQYRCGRVAVQYHDVNNPGALFIAATTPNIIADIVPSVTTRRKQKIWLRSPSDMTPLLPQDALPNITANVPDETASPFHLQLTRFACGGVAIGIRLHHVLGDAHTLLRFAKIISSAMKTAPETGPPLLRFQPEQLDARASGDVNAFGADERLRAKALSAPLLRLDWYAPAANAPAWVKGPPIAIADREDVKIPTGDPMPWGDWDTAAPVDHAVFHFSDSDVERIYTTATATTTTAPTTGFLTHHDALLAHIWLAIVLARSRAYSGTSAALASTDTMHANTSFSLRPPSRLNLGPDFAGSPIQLANVTLPLSAFTSSSYSAALPLIARTFRSTLNTLGREVLQAQLHALAYEASPQRIWQAFLGRKHVIFTSWVREGSYEVDFGRAMGGARWMECVMSDLDGIVVLCEAAKDASDGDGKEEGKGEGKWWADGVDVAVHLERRALAELVGDEAFLMRS